MYNKGGRSVGLKREDGDYTIISDDNEKKEEKPETPVETTTPNPNDGKLKEEKQFTSPTVSSSLDSKKSDDGSGDDLIKGIQNDPGYSDIKSAEARKKGETIDNKNLENENKKDQDEKGENIISNLKIRAEKFFGNIGQQQTNDLKVTSKLRNKK